MCISFWVLNLLVTDQLPHFCPTRLYMFFSFFRHASVSIFSKPHVTWSMEAKDGKCETKIQRKNRGKNKEILKKL